MLLLSGIQQNLFSLDFNSSFEFVSNYVKDGAESKTPAFVPEFKLESQNGFLFHTSGVFPFKEKAIPSKNTLELQNYKNNLYYYQFFVGAGYKYTFNPVFSAIIGTEYQYLYHMPEDDYFFNASLNFQFILGASLKAAYSLNQNYAVIEMPLSYQYLLKSFELEIRTNPLYFISSDKNQFKAWTHSLILSYLFNESASMGISLNSSYSFIQKDTVFYASLFMNLGF